jgi:hypothetical protein
MFGDIQKTLSLDDHPGLGAPNFLLALGLCCYTEYWGKLVKGIKKNELRRSQEAFDTFLRRMDPTHYGKLLQGGVNLYNEVRCGLAHAYLIDAKGDVDINAGYSGLHGIDYDQAKKKYIFWIRTYFDEFKNAVNQYINGLEDGTENVRYLEDSLNGRAELI